MRDDIVCVRADGGVEGPHPPSSELPFHQAIYAARPDLHAIVHAHPVALVACSISRQVPDTRLFHQRRHVCGAVGFALRCREANASRRISRTRSRPALRAWYSKTMESWSPERNWDRPFNALKRSSSPRRPSSRPRIWAT